MWCQHPQFLLSNPIIHISRVLLRNSESSNASTFDSVSFSVKVRHVPCTIRSYAYIYSFVEISIEISCSCKLSSVSIFRRRPPSTRFSKIRLSTLFNRYSRQGPLSANDAFVAVSNEQHGSCSNPRVPVSETTRPQMSRFGSSFVRFSPAVDKKVIEGKAVEEEEKE